MDTEKRKWLEILVTERQKELLLLTINQALDSQTYFADEDENDLMEIRNEIRDADF